MPDEKTRLPDGLPARFQADKDGLKNLYNFLGIENRQQRQAILKSNLVKQAVRRLKGVARLKTSEREKTLITAFYKQSRERRDLWKTTIEHDDEFLVPSLEFRAVQQYDPDFRESEAPDLPEEIFGAASETPAVPEWQRPAFGLWPELRRDLREWKKLTDDRRDAVTLALFAVATVLDDVRWLRWASAQVPDLFDEFAFCLDEHVAAKAGCESDVTISANVVSRWSAACDVVAHHASTLREKPWDTGCFDELRRQVKVLDELQALAVAEAPGVRIDQVRELVSDLAAEFGELPIASCAEDIVAQWRKAHRVNDAVDAAALNEDVNRFRRELPDAVLDWQRAHERAAALLHELEEVEREARTAPDPASRFKAEDRKAELHEQIAEAGKTKTAAGRRVLRVAAPGGCEFDPAAGDERSPSEDDAATTASREDDAQTPDRDTLLTPEPSGVDAAEQLPRDQAPGSDDASSDGEPAQIEQPQSLREPAADEPRSQAAPTDDPVSVASPLPERESATTALWQTFRQGRQGIAHHIARLLAENGVSEPAFPPANLIAASMLANHVQSNDSSVVSALREIIAGLDPDKLVQDGWSDEDNDAVKLLLFSAALRPSLFAPDTGAVALLRQVKAPGNLQPVYELAQVVADHADRLRGVRLDASLATLGDRWPEEFHSFVSRVREWRKQAPSKRNLFDRANRVWRDLLNGPLKELAALIERADDTGADKVEAIRREMASRKEFDALVKKTDRKNRRGNPIQGRALKQLWNDVQPAVKFADEWFRLLDARPRQPGFVDRRIDALEKDVDKYGKEAIAAINDALKTDDASSALAAALNQTRTTVEQLLRVFDDSGPASDSVGKSANILSRDLLYVTNLEITPQFAPKTHRDSPSVLDLLIDTAAHANTARAAFDARLERQDLIGAHLACDLIEANDDAAVDECREILVRKTRERQKELRKVLAAEEARMESAFCRGQIDPDQREEMAASLASLRKFEQSPVSRPLSLDEVAKVDSGVRKVDAIGHKIKSSLEKRIDETRKRLDALPPDRLNKETKATVNRTIDEGYILTASEQISRLEKEEPIAPPPTEDDPFGEFMSSVGEIERARRESDASPLAIVRRVRARTPAAGVSFDKLTAEEADQAAGLLDAWYKLAKKQRVDRNLLQSLLQRLGFMVLDVTGDHPHRRGWPRAEVRTEAIEDRDLCPSRQFGSQSKGRYRVLLSWEQPADESIVRSMGNEGGIPTVVLHFGCLGDDRDKLRRWAIQTHRLFLVIDEALALFLAGRPSRRLSALFRCSLPFTSVEPYATTSGLVPPELFYGREYERQNVMEQSGACFIYGGRQLGKTALLRRVESDFTRSRDTHFAHWIDLKANEIGYGRGPHDIWLVLQRELRRFDIVGKRRDRELDPKDRRQVESFVESIRQWLDERADRRLILLLDEADEFLVKDAETDFRESTRLKGLMDDTDRRFKVVFAGLHNVLRTTHQANHPLAHFGDPICIGAMLSNGEWRQAQALVREPLHAVGCRFGHDDLSTRILALTNYYPSLIQLYGAELLRRLRDSLKKFPYEIGDDDIDDAYASSELRSAIRERFLLTLQLDQRYEVIAYALVLELHGDAALNEGLTPREIAEEVRSWWREGFDLQDVEFSMLLQEMEGLGVLRSVGDRYTLRNPNILLLLGKSDDVQNALSRPRNLPTTYEPKSYRGRRPEDQTSSRRCPLTYLQESDLMRTGGVAVITGCNAAGLENVEEFLSQRMGRELFRKLPSVADALEFEQQLKEQHPVRNGLTVCLVPREVAWDASWLQSAQRVLKRRARGRTMWMRVAFIAPPEQLWRLLSDAGDQNADDVQWIDVGPWDKTFLRKWLEDINDSATVEHTGDLWEASGGWTEALDSFSKMRRNKSWRTRIDNLKRETQKDADRLMSEGFGLSNEAQQMLRTLFDIAGDEPFEPDDGAQLVSEDIGVDRGEVLRRLDWSGRLGLLTRVGEGRLTFNPLVRRLIEATDTG